MPAITPVSASGPPLARNMMRLRPGAMSLATPRTSKLKVSILPPWNTVRPTPFMPTLISWIAMVAGGGSAAAARGHRRAARQTVRRVFKGKGMRISAKGKPSRIETGGPPEERFPIWCRDRGWSAWGNAYFSFSSFCRARTGPARPC